MLPTATLSRLLFAAVLAGILSAQAPIRVDVNLVNVSFAVKDARGNFVSGLTKDDFEVFEDSTPQTISFFARSSDLPLNLGLISDASGSQEHFLKKHDRDLKAFLKSVIGPQNRCFLVCFGNNIRLVSDYTSSQDLLMDRLKEFDRGDRKFPKLGPPDEDRELGTAFYDSIYYSVTERLAGEEGGRRALLMFSDGEDNSSAHHMLDAIEAAQGAGVLVYGIRYTEERHGRPTARNKYGTSVMARIALETGAADYDASDGDMRNAFKQIGDELRNSYELAYHSTNPVKDGTFRKISIRPKNPALKVRCKTGYFAR